MLLNRTLVYVAGPYNGDIDRNIQQAREVSIAVWRAGHVALTPHLNTAHFEVDAGLPEDRYYDGDLLLLSKCDAVVLTPDWEKSTGAKLEYAWALDHGLPIYVYPDMPKAVDY